MKSSMRSPTIFQACAQRAVKICGLVCRQWLTRSRYHLFRRVTLTAKNLGPFVDLVDTSFLPILPLIRLLQLDYWGMRLDTAHLARLHCCPNLTHIRIEILHADRHLENPYPDASWLDSDEYLQTHLRSWSSNSAGLLRLSLNFHAYATLPIHTITHLLSCFPALESVDIHDVTTFVGGAGADLSSVPVNLAHLHIHALVYKTLIFTWLLSLPTPPTLKSLRLTGASLDANETQLLEAYLRRAGQRIETLELLPLGGTASSILPKVFPHLTSLRNLSTLCTGPSNILETLSGLHALNLSALCIRIPYMRRDEDLLWPAVDAALAGLRFIDNLRSLSIRTNTRPHITLARTKELLPLADARGILV
ncbi:hypothetical protein B0H11DRAFT_2056729 [Mycena galericulata]|nr:hypothetical protein B0H11DRAFT_2056729 [Mycena galericulata]